MATHFIGCTHFDHANIIRLANRPFGDVDTMNEAMVKAWNAKVKRGDDVYHLGDFGWIKDASRLDALMQKLPGNLHLIVGNHDGDKVTKHPRWCSVRPYAEVEVESQKLVLFHYPIEEWSGFYRGAMHLHCHTHQADPLGKVHIPGRFNVTVEAWNYAPVSLADIRPTPPNGD